jgi:hypothetical protein
MLASLVVLALLGCSSKSSNDKVCPRVAVLSDAGSLTRFRPGPGRDILDIDFQAEIGDLVAACQFSGEKDDRRLVVQTAPVFVVSRGAANTDRKAAFTYFVSVIRTDEILTKELFEASAEFAGNRSRVIVQDDQDPVTIEMSLPYRDAEYEYQILIGFQLTQEELEYNQRWYGLGR